jgi:Tfp pilus assembly protein PilF
MWKLSWRAVCCFVFLFSLPLYAQDSKQLLPEAQRQYQIGKFDDAVRIYKSILNADPSSTAAHSGLILTLLKKDEVLEAYQTARQAISVAPESAPVHAAMGDVRFRRGQFAEAETEYKKALQLDGRLARGWWGLAQIATCASMHKTANQYYRKAHELDPSDPDVLLGWAHTLKSSSQRISALENYLSLVQIEEPEKLEPIRTYIETLKQLGDRKSCVMTSPYVKTEMQLQQLLYNPQTPRGWGLRVGFNGGKPQTLLLDTGARGITINRKMADKIGVRRLAGEHMTGIGDKGPVTGYLGLIERVQIGDVEFHDCVVSVSDRTSVADQGGLIGSDVFSEFLVMLDFPQRMLRLDPLPAREKQPEENEPYDRFIPPQMQLFTPIFRFGHMLLISTKVNDSEPVLFLVDTGASLNLISRDLARETTAVSQDDTLRVRGLSGNVRNVYSAQKVVLQFARFRQENRDMVSFDFKKLSRFLGTEVSGILGLPLLNFLTIGIDYRDGLVDFTYHPPR